MLFNLHLVKFEKNSSKLCALMDNGLRKAKPIKFGQVGRMLENVLSPFAVKCEDVTKFSTLLSGFRKGSNLKKITKNKKHLLKDNQGISSNLS
jgi:hypothetical protein